MITHLFRTTIAAAAVAALSACGGGGGGSAAGGSGDIGSSIVQISFDEPQGLLEAGRFVTVTGRATSKNAKLTAMNWTVAGAGTATSAPTVTNADCANTSKSDSSFGAGSSNWVCVITLQAPKTLSEATTYELGLSASSATYSGKGSTRVTIKPAVAEINPVRVEFGALPSLIRAGEAININGVVSSSASKVTGARWTIVNSGPNQNSTFPIPTLSNADCAIRTEETNPTGLESSSWNCAVRMVVSPRLDTTANYKLTLVGTNANGFALSNTLNVPVSPALAITNKVSVTLDAAPTGVKAGDKITISGRIKSTGSTLDTAKSGFVVVNLTPINGLTGPQDYTIASKCLAVANPTGTTTSEISCIGNLTVPTTVITPVTLTYALSGVDDEGFSNFATKDITVQPRSDAFGARVDVAYSPLPVVPGAPVNLTCAAQGAGAGNIYSWRVANSGGTSINLSSATTTTGNASFNAPAPSVNTNVVVECGVSDGFTTTYTPLTVTIPGSTSPLGFRAEVNATPNPVAPGATVNLTCQGLGVANATYTYGWKVTNANGTTLRTVTSTGPNSGAASFVAPAVPTTAGTGTTAASTTVTLTCSVSDGTRVVDSPLDVVIVPTPANDAFGARANVAYAPVPVVPGAPVNLTCAAQGGGSNYTYSWRVANAGGTAINLSSATTTTGNASFISPSPVANTDVVVECGVFDGVAVKYTPLTVTIPGSASPFGTRANVAYAPVPVVPGAPVNLTCAAQGGGSNYTYSWRVANSGGTAVSLSNATTTTGNTSFISPSPLVNTDVVVECGVFDGKAVAYTPLTVKIPGSTSPLGFRADVNATPNPVKSGQTVNLTCQGLGVANATYSYAWKVVNSNGTGLSTVTSAGTNTGAASFVAPALPAGTGGAPATSKTVTLACTVSDGTRVVESPLDVIITP